MRRSSLLLLLFFSGSFSFGQNINIRAMTDSLHLVKADTFDCNAGLYWRIIAEGEKAIPFLIEKLTDTTATNFRYHCKKTRLNVGEVAHFALISIADFPAFVVTKIQFDVISIDETGQGCWSFYDFLFINANKPRYQRSVQDWWEKEKENYALKKIPENLQTDCMKKYKINTFYKWKDD